MLNEKFCLGTVKWFGGQNNRTGKVNPFGFIANAAGDDLFVHQKQLKNTSSLSEDELVLFQVEKTPKGLAAANVYVIQQARSDDTDSVPVEQIASFLAAAEDLDKIPSASPFIKRLISYFETAELNVLLLRKLIDRRIDKTWILKLLQQTKCHEQLFELLLGEQSLRDFVLQYKHVSLAPRAFLDRNISELESYLHSISTDIQIQQVDELIEVVSFNTFLFLLFKNLITKQNKLDKHEKQLTRFIKATVLGQKQEFEVAQYVRDAYAESFSSFSDYCQHPVVAPIALPLSIKRKIFKQDMSFVKDIRNNPVLASNFEYWFLSTLIPLLFKQNHTDVIEPVILTSLWQKLLDVNSEVDEDEVFALFPHCRAIGQTKDLVSLSCEAFHWRTPENEDKFLCRSKVCKKPEVVPNLTKSFLDYSVFDWLAHYGYHYFEQSKPMKRDFPIKLAAYLNRVRELKSKLDCRCCGQLMIPNMKYARVEVTTVNEETGEETTVPMQSSYRLTVFKCNNHSCQEVEKNYYFNHCLNYKCYTIIDSRDDLNKCSEDRYNCPECGSCCNTHAEKPKFRN
jgi:cold shock CspA family protein